MTWLFWKDKEQRGPWPTPEVDYDGNMMWANAFPKRQPSHSGLYINPQWEMFPNAAYQQSVLSYYLQMCQPMPAYCGNQLLRPLGSLF